MHTETTPVVSHTTPTHDFTSHNNFQTYHDTHHHQGHHDQHHHHQDHHHQDHRHHRHNHDGDPDSREPPVEVIYTVPVQYYGTQPHTCRCSHCKQSDQPSSPVQILIGVVFLGIFIVWMMFILSHIESDNRRTGPWLSYETASAPGSIDDRVNDILTSTPLIDSHNDFAIFLRENYSNSITNERFLTKFLDGKMEGNTDLARLRKGKVGGAFWSAYTECPPNASFDMSNANYANGSSETLEQLDLLRRLQAQYPDDFTPAIPTAKDPSGRLKMMEQWAKTRSFFGALSIEGLHQVPPTSPFSSLRLYHSLGVRMATLTWNCHNPFADASVIFNEGFKKPPLVVNDIFRKKEGAVTTRGKQVLQEMNRLGMIIDISHTSYWTQKAVLSADKDGKRITRAPVVYSHSSAYSICPHPRNVRDDNLDRVRETNSLVMVNFSPGFISCVPNTTDSTLGEPHFSLPIKYEKNNTLHQVARHITYIGDRIGYDYVGIGSDFDGMGEEHPRGLDGVDKFPDLVAELLKMGVSDEDAKKVVGGNILRVWAEVDAVAAQMAKEGVQPGVDDVHYGSLQPRQGF